MKPRAILLSIAGLTPDEIDKILPETAPEPETTSLQSDFGALEIIDFDVETSFEQIEITSYGDAYRQYMPGRRSCTFHMKVVTTPTLNAHDMVGREMRFDEEIGGHRVTATLLVVEVRTEHEVGSLSVTKITAHASGPVLIDHGHSGQPEPLQPRPEGRAIDLSDGVK